MAAAKRVVMHVGAVWNALDKLHDLPGKNPATRVTTHSIQPRTDRIDHDDMPDWYTRVQQLNPLRRDLHILCLYTGLRSESARHAQWEHIDWKKKVLYVELAKGDRPYAVPLPAVCITMLKKRRKDNVKLALLDGFDGGEGWIYPTYTRSKPYEVIPIQEAREERVDDSGVKHKFVEGLHPLRKTFNSIAIEIGVSKHDCERLMNHEGAGVNARLYGFPQDWSHLAKVQAKIAKAITARLKAEKVRSTR